MTGKQRRVLAIIATDRTFEPSRHGTEPVWVGACIHCRSPLTVDVRGVPVSSATIEHIWPQRHGGGNDLDNVALACGKSTAARAGVTTSATVHPWRSLRSTWIMTSLPWMSAEVNCMAFLPKAWPFSGQSMPLNRMRSG